MKPAPGARAQTPRRAKRTARARDSNRSGRGILCHCTPSKRQSTPWVDVANARKRAHCSQPPWSPPAPLAGYSGIRTLSTTWMTPFLVMMLAAVTMDMLILTPLFKSTATLLPSSKVGTMPGVRSPEPTAPETTW